MEEPEEAPLSEPAPVTPEPESAPPEPIVEQVEEIQEVEPAPEEEAEPEPTVAGLEAARRALSEADVRRAAEEYGDLIKEKRELEAVVDDLEEYLAEGEAPLLWQTLGDAYMRLNRTKDAVRAFNRGMEETEFLDSARQALAAGDFKRATAQYAILIKHKTELETVIDDLEQALDTADGSPVLWQTLGDAYMKAGRVDESIRAYRRGMESV